MAGTLIIDGNNLVHRTYWVAKNQAIRTNTANTPEQINNFHIYFTLNAIFSYVTKFQPDKTIVVWDEKLVYRVNERKTMFGDYKGGRSTDNSPHQNNNTIKSMLRSLGIASIFPSELEADDIVAYICKNYDGHKMIVSVDKDFIQLIDKTTSLYDPIRKIEYNYQNLYSLIGYSDVSLWFKAKCLAGDKSDNVPGIPKFGKAKIKKYLEGQIELSEDEQAIFDRNNSLFNLNKITDNEAEQEYYKTQLEVKVESNWDEFIMECKNRAFNSILNKKESWYSLFFLRNKLQSLFT
jgi:5'-3' exonuclease